MANSILDLIKQQVTAQTGNVEIPAQAKNQVLNGLTDSIFGSLTQTVTKPGGIEAIKSLLTGKTAAASSPITALAGSLFSNNILCCQINSCCGEDSFSMHLNTLGQRTILLHDGDQF